MEYDSGGRLSLLSLGSADLRWRLKYASNSSRVSLINEESVEWQPGMGSAVPERAANIQYHADHNGFIQSTG